MHESFDANIAKQMQSLDLLKDILQTFTKTICVKSDHYTINASVTEVRVDFRDWKFLACPRVVCEDDKLAYELSFSTIVGLKLATMGALYVFSDGRITCADNSEIQARGVKINDRTAFADVTDLTCSYKLFEFLWREFFKSDLVKV
jgi:hypothetical protein